jgi:hypothetical protein
LVINVNEGKIEGRVEVTGTPGGRRKKLVDGLKNRMQEIERGTRFVGNELLKRLWTCRETDCRVSGH